MTITLDGTAGITYPTTQLYAGNIASGSINAGGATPFPASAGPSAVAYTNIPSWVRRITLMLTGVSTNGTSNIIVQLGTGSTTYTTTGYTGSTNIQTGASGTNFSSGFIINNATGLSDVSNGQIVINSFGSNTWVESGIVGLSNAAGARYSAGYVLLSAALTAVQLTTAGGTDLFDAGSVNILYE